MTSGDLGSEANDTALAGAPVRPAYPLYPYQRQVLGQLLDALGTGPSRQRRVVAHLPTGAGKTRVACHAAAALLNRYSAENKLVVWLASSEELCQQAAESLTSAWQHIGNRAATVHRYWGSAEELGNLSEGFLVAGLPKLWAANQREPGFLTAIADRTAGLIFDEAHQAVARTYRFVTEQLATYGPPLLGLTATPGRSAEPGEGDLDLAEMFGGRKVTIDPRGHDSVITYLISGGYLADPEFRPVTLETETRIAEPVSGADYSAHDLGRLGRDSKWSARVVDLTRRALGAHRRVMVFCPSVGSAVNSARAISRGGLRSAAITAETPKGERESTISRFRGNDEQPMALFNYGVLTAGFDAPRTSCVIVARPTTSLVLYSQMVGRAMRGRRSGGNRRCEIYTVADISQHGFGSVVESFTNWEALWRSK